MVSYKHFTALFFFLLISRGVFPQGWFPLNSGTATLLTSIYFTDSFTGYSVGDTGVIIKTTNQGLNWTRQVSNSTVLLTSVNFGAFGSAVSSIIGFTVGGGGTILRTTNAGINWVQQTSNLTNYLYSVHVTSLARVYAAHYNGVTMTSNGGVNWVNVYTSPEPLYAINFVDSLTGYAGGGSFANGTYVVKTTNGGLNWFYGPIGSTGIVTSIFFIRQFPSIGYAATGFTGVMKTTNGGANWNNVYPAGTISSVYFVSRDTGYAAGLNGTIIKTTNGGLSWTSQNTGTNNNLVFIYFTNRDTGYCSGFNGMILKTTTGGLVGFQNGNNQTPSEFQLYQNYPNPFNPVTKIRFDIPPSKGVGAMTKLTVYDILGSELTTLLNKQLKPDTYEVEWDASNYPSGVYYYRMTASEYTETRRMVLIK